MLAPDAPRVAERRPSFEIADIFRAHGEAYRQTHTLTSAQRGVMAAIEACRTAVLGGHVDVCTDCGYARPAYNSCRNRHCPKCQALAQARWIEQRKTRILPTHYFHVVFTLPHQLLPLCHSSPRQMYDLLFAAACNSLLEFGESRLGARIGVTAVLHTWTRKLLFHPHVHCVVTGGGLAMTEDRWASARRDYLFSVRALSQLYRGKFLAALADAYERGELDLGGACVELRHAQAFAALTDQLYDVDWVVYAKRPFGGPEQVFRYLGRYTHRIALSNRRLLRVDDDGVCFATKNGKSVTVTPTEFIRRFLLHVLPKGYVRIRHFGLMSSGNVATKLVVARRLLQVERGAPKVAVTTDGESTDAISDWRAWFRELTGIDVNVCPQCGGATMKCHPLLQVRATPVLDTS